MKLPEETRFCHVITTPIDDRKFLKTHRETLNLYQNSGLDDRTLSFVWNRWVEGNYILDPEFIPLIKTSIQSMSDDLKKRSIEGGVTDINQLAPDARARLFLERAIDRVFDVGTDKMYFGKDGVFYYIDDRTIEAHSGDILSLRDKGHFGTWEAKGDYVCWYLDMAEGCEYIFPSGKGLIRDYDGVMGMHNSGFTRIYGELGVDFLSPEQTKAPELFSSLSK